MQLGTIHVAVVSPADQEIFAYSWHHHLRDPRIQLHPAYAVSLYSTAYPSLQPAFAQPVHLQRLTNLSTSDISSFRSHIESALTNWQSDIKKSHRPVDWLGIVQAIMDRNGDRLSELKTVLQTRGANLTALIDQARLVTYTMLMPYINVPQLESSIAQKRPVVIRAAVRECSVAFTGHLERDGFNTQENALVDAIESVLSRLCHFNGDWLSASIPHLLIHSSAARSTSTKKAEEKLLNEWHQGLQDLMKWLAWPMWHHCPNQCADDVSFISADSSKCLDHGLTGNLFRIDVAFARRSAPW